MVETSPLFAQTYDFLSWLLPRTESFPRVQRFVVTKRLQDAALDFLECIVDAEKARGTDRVQYLRRADGSLDLVRLYLRLSREWGWLNSGQYEHAARMVTQMGNLLGGWIRKSGRAEQLAPKTP